MIIQNIHIWIIIKIRDFRSHNHKEGQYSNE
jgi:hypothetical protein